MFPQAPVGPGLSPAALMVLIPLWGFDLVGLVLCTAGRFVG